MSKSTQSTVPNPVQVAVAIVMNATGEVLISRRKKSVHLEGLWEFPGGKIEQGETSFSALQREMKEETGLDILTARPLICINHQYTEKSVCLDTWLVEDWAGYAQGLEGQEIYWASLSELKNFKFPAADKPIISALNLPDSYQITPEPDENIESFLSSFEACLSQGQRLFQLRSKSLTTIKLQKYISPVAQLCERYQAKWLINSDPSDAVKYNSNGVHLDSKRLLNCHARPLSSEYLVAASCHNLIELKHAESIDVDFAVLAPVKKTLTHPEVEPLGLVAFQELIEAVNIPVYALGGMSREELVEVWKLGGQGVAMIRSGWPDDD